MKIQSLAVIAIIIILPMSIILSSYTSNQIKTLDLQISYDTKLANATYDAIKSFQLNMSNSSTSDLADSKMKDIEASINTFYNSLSSNFDMSGYGNELLQEYVPAIVYTLYDGYYIYSAYTNTLDPADTFDENAKYQDGQELFGLKPYINYSCRYKTDDDDDFVITYSLDSYITIQGYIDGEVVNDSGYLLTDIYMSDDKVYYKEFEITAENEKQRLKQNVYVENDDGTGGEIKELYCKKINGAKYYCDEKDKVFTIINGKKFPQNHMSAEDIKNNTSAIEFYKQACEFKQRIMYDYDLGGLTSGDAVDQYGNSYSEDIIYPGYMIFDELDSSNIFIESKESEFYAHKMQVIKNSIESNLMVAIANYNNVSSVENNFAMPKLKEEEWEKISNNITMITFLQGLNIGGKIYSGYSIVPNNTNEDYISEDDIFIAGKGDTYCKITDKDIGEYYDDTTIGILKSDFERKTVSVGDNDVKYYYPREEVPSYASIVDPNGAKNNFSYQDNKLVMVLDMEKVAKLYYTALGRERCGMYRVNNPYIK